MALACVERISMICAAVFTQFRCVTDGRRTDVLRQHSRRYAQRTT